METKKLVLNEIEVQLLNAVKKHQHMGTTDQRLFGYLQFPDTVIDPSLDHLCTLGFLTIDKKSLDLFKPYGVFNIRDKGLIYLNNRLQSVKEEQKERKRWIYEIVIGVAVAVFSWALGKYL